MTTYTLAAESTRDARQWLRGLLDEPHEDAELILTELSTNAFVHGQPPVTCTVDVAADHLTIRISQPAETDPVQVRLPDVRTAGGRGMQLVDALSKSWGSQLEDGVLTVWATLPNPQAS